jgi:cytochrome c-type biogenesis protein CcmH
MIFWAIAGILTLATVLAIIWPILKSKTSDEDRPLFNLHVYSDQLAELEKDHQQGRIGNQDKDSARLEIQRRMLASTKEIEEQDSKKILQRPNPFNHMLIAVLLAFLIPSLALGTYIAVGKPNLPSLPFNKRVSKTAAKLNASPQTAHQQEGIGNMINSLQEKVKGNPKDIKSWELLGKTYLMKKQYSKAAQTLQRALELTPDNLSMRAAFAESLTLAADGLVTKESEIEFKLVEKGIPGDPRAQFYLGLADYQRNNREAALKRWVSLEVDTPKNAPWRLMLEARIKKATKETGIDISALKLAEITKRPIQTIKTKPDSKKPNNSAKIIPGPSQSQIAAAKNMATSDRQAMIKGMVTRLADRLAETPDDLDGWLRLARSYTVLNQPKEALKAFGRAAALAPERIDVQMSYGRALFPQGTPETEMPIAFKLLIKNILVLEPNNPEIMFYGGIVANLDGNYALARNLWSRLLEKMGKDAPARKSIEQRLKSLKFSN